MDFADAKAQRRMDGRSLLPLMDDGLFSPGRPIVLEAYFNADDPDENPETPPTNYQAVRTDRYLYARYGTGEQELYDLYLDPYELRSRHADPSFASVKADLERLLASSANCSGKGCAARPALNVKLSFRNGGGCVAGAVKAKLGGTDAGEIASARFFVGTRKAGNDGSAPFRGEIGAARLGSDKNRISANATLADGRVVTVKSYAPGSC